MANFYRSNRIHLYERVDVCQIKQNNENGPMSKCKQRAYPAHVSLMFALSSLKESFVISKLWPDLFRKSSEKKSDGNFVFI